MGGTSKQTLWKTRSNAQGNLPECPGELTQMPGRFIQMRRASDLNAYTISPTTALYLI